MKLGSVIAFWGVVAGITIFVASNSFQSESTRLAVKVAAFVVIAIATFYSIVRDVTFRSQRLSEIDEELKQVREVPADANNLDKLRQFTREAYLEAEKIGESAHFRATMLFWFGAAFLLASIAAPMATLYVYSTSDPLPPETAERVEKVGAALTTSKTALSLQTTLNVQRDWRVLLSGVTFGFLLLAAGAGLLKQRGKEFDVYFLVMERVNHYRRIFNVLQIKADVLKESDQQVAEFLSEKLIERDPPVNRGTEEDDVPSPDSITKSLAAFKTFTS